MPGIGGKSFGVNIPSIPKLAKGTIVDRPTVAMIGEAGTEAVMPLENNTGWIDKLAGQISAIIGDTGGGSQAPTVVELNMDGNTFARAILPYTDKEQSRRGRLSSTVRVVT